MRQTKKKKNETDKEKVHKEKERNALEECGVSFLAWQSQTYIRCHIPREHMYIHRYARAIADLRHSKIIKAVVTCLQAIKAISGQFLFPGFQQQLGTATKAISGQFLTSPIGAKHFPRGEVGPQG
jgi:hypothetical protein